MSAGCLLSSCSVFYIHELLFRSIIIPKPLPAFIVDERRTSAIHTRPSNALFMRHQPSLHIMSFLL